MALPTRILVPIDLSPASEEALSYARALAARVGATLELLHAIDPRGVDGLLGPADPTVWQGVLDKAQARLEALAGAGEELRQNYAGFESDFLAFFPDALLFAADWRRQREG